MFKLGMALVFAVISALIIILTGLSSDVRLTTILLRSLAGFLVAGAVVWLIAFFLETRNLVDFDQNPEPVGNPETKEPKSPEEYEAEDAQAAAEEEAQPAPEKNEEQPAEFKPLGAENFRHMEAPPDHA